MAVINGLEKLDVLILLPDGIWPVDTYELASICVVSLSLEMSTEQMFS